MSAGEIIELRFKGIEERLLDLEHFQAKRQEMEQTELERRIRENYEMRDLIRQAVSDAVGPIMDRQNALDRRIITIENKPKENSHKILMWVVGVMSAVFTAIAIALVRAAFKI